MKSLICKKFLFVSILIIPGFILAQSRQFTHQDTLRGSVTKERIWWDLKFYHLDLKVDPADSSISGKNNIYYEVLTPFELMQIDLQKPMKITKAKQDTLELDVLQDGNAWFIRLKKKQKPGETNSIEIEYSGKPVVSKNPPWSGGLSWKKDSQNKPFIVTTCQGDGASLWWPCKDHQYDEPDSMLLSITVPDGLTEVSNGRLRGIVGNTDKTMTFNWFVSNPINNYGVNVNIADYAHFSENYIGEKGILTCDYYVLKGNLEKARIHFQEVPRMLKAFEHWFGPYPFYEDGYKLVEVPYPGMEHQSSVTYGNNYQNGFGKNDVSHTGWGMKFDFIIIHESAHEWFGNSVTYKDIADMWIHESFAAYSETLFTEFQFGRKAGDEYLRGTRANIRNNRPIIGEYDVNYEGSGDMYCKGANMLHTLRQIVDDDEKWLSLLRGINSAFYHQTVTTLQIEKFISDNLCFDLTSFFNQYLRNAELPVFEYEIQDSMMKFRWNDCVSGFDFPLKIKVNEKEKWISPTSKWKQIEVEKESKISVDPNFYILVLNLKEKKEKEKN